MKKQSWKHKSKYYSSSYINTIEIPDDQEFVTKERYKKDIKKAKNVNSVPIICLMKCENGKTCDLEFKDVDALRKHQQSNVHRR